MEFATEMVIKASLQKARIGEVPITLHPDGRQGRAPHLRTFRDGWRTLRFFLLYSPRWLFLYPGFALIGAGLIGYAVGMPGVRIAGVRFDAHTLLFSSLAILLGHQSIIFAILAKTYAVGAGLLPQNERMETFHRVVTLERGLVVSLTGLTLGFLLLLAAVNQWRIHDFGDLEYTRTMRLVVPGVTLTALGGQTLLASFFSALMRRPTQ